MAAPRVSIIVPSYNHGRFVDACVQSVVAQTFTDWEMIVIDDGSKDDSAERFRSYADSRIKVFVNESNLGTYGTQNRAVSLCSSELISVLNSDDFWAPHKLEKQIETLERHPDAPFAFTLGWRTDEAGVADESFDNQRDWPTDERFELAPYLIESNHILASGVIFRRSWAEFNQTLRYSGDWAALFRASSNSAPACVSERLTFWRQHGSNTSQVPLGVTGEEIRVRRALLETVPDLLADARFDSNLVQRMASRCHLHLAPLYLLWGNRRAAIASCRKAAAEPEIRATAIKRLIACLGPRSSAARRFFPGVETLPKWSEWNHAPMNLLSSPHVQSSRTASLDV